MHNDKENQIQTTLDPDMVPALGVLLEADKKGKMSLSGYAGWLICKCIDENSFTYFENARAVKKSIRLDPKYVVFLKEKAAEHGVSVSEISRKILLFQMNQRFEDLSSRLKIKLRPKFPFLIRNVFLPGFIVLLCTIPVFYLNYFKATKEDPAYAFRQAKSTGADPVTNLTTVLSDFALVFNTPGSDRKNELVLTLIDKHIRQSIAMGQAQAIQGHHDTAIAIFTHTREAINVLGPDLISLMEDVESYKKATLEGLIISHESLGQNGQAQRYQEILQSKDP